MDYLKEAVEQKFTELLEARKPGRYAHMSRSELEHEIDAESAYLARERGRGWVDREAENNIRAMKRQLQKLITTKPS
ncbi:MAG: hypothetical protein WCY93_11410 [Anaerolineaceae bacterium]